MTSTEESNVPPVMPALATVAHPICAGHLSRLQQLLRIERALEQLPPRPRDRQPNPRQQLQWRIRHEAVSCYHALHDQGLTLAQCGQLFALSPRTLRLWDQECRAERLALAAVGRPASRSCLAVRQTILDYLQVTGPGLGVPSLRENFPNVPRAELADLLNRYRAVWRARHHSSGRVLHWQTPGRVWAVDFTEPQVD